MDTLVVSALPIRNEDISIPIPKHIHSKSNGSPGNVNWLSWRLAGEANNIIGWDIVPTGFESHIKEYMLGNQYLEDSKFVIGQALRYVQTLHHLPVDGKNVWVFDIDETILSNLPYFIEQGFGSGPYENMSAQEFKCSVRAKLEKEGYRIVGNIGDQWSDLMETSSGQRVFKLSNPMYFIL